MAPRHSRRWWRQWARVVEQLAWLAAVAVLLSSRPVARLGGRAGWVVTALFVVAFGLHLAGER